jgi:hypothetical protein
MSLKVVAAAALAFQLSLPSSAHAGHLADLATQWVAVTVSETLCKHGTPGLLQTMQRDLAVGLSGELEEDVEQVNFEVGVHRLVSLVLQQASLLVANAEPDDADCAMGQIYVEQLIKAAHDRADTRLRIKLEGASSSGRQI